MHDITISISVNFDDAINYANGLRCISPALYNSTRENEMPIPPTSVRVDDNDDESSVGETTSENQFGYVSIHAELPINESVDQPNFETEDVKPTILPAVELDSTDVNAFDDLFNTLNDINNDKDPLANSTTVTNEDHDVDTEGTDNSIDTTNVADIDDSIEKSMESLEIATTSKNAVTESAAESAESFGTANALNSPANVSPVRNEQNHANHVVFDDGLELTFNSLQDFRPYMENEFQIKANDVLCKNRPFKPNVNVSSFFSNSKWMSEWNVII